MSHQNVKKIITSHLTLAVQAAEKIKKKYRQKRIGKKAAKISTDGSCFKQENKKAVEWLKDKGFLDDIVSVEKADVRESIDLKKTSSASNVAKNIVKKYRDLARKKPYEIRPARIFTEDNNNDVEDIIDLGDIETLKPSENVQIAAKKITENFSSKKNVKESKADDIDFKIIDSQVVDDVTNARLFDDHIDFSVTDLRVVDDDIDFNMTVSRVFDDESDIDFDITDSRVITNQNTKIAAKKIKQECKNISQRKELKSLRLAALRDKTIKIQLPKKVLY